MKDYPIIPHVPCPLGFEGCDYCTRLDSSPSTGGGCKSIKSPKLEVATARVLAILSPKILASKPLASPAFGVALAPVLSSGVQKYIPQNKYQYIGVCINVFTISTAVY